ncbi:MULTISPECIES: NAD(P)-binding protein [unclassified Moraxella]|uniref:NAD(P)-binding protein n=1 Tax=unclassified Moraxella TaxID=2685852 RepID=UPI003AF6D6B2
MTITRRDFLNGTAIAIGGTATGLLTACQKTSTTTDTTKATASSTSASASTHATPNSNYPPEKLGLRGNQQGSYDVAHQMGWQHKSFDVTTLDNEGDYDLVVVGAGISGLSTAYFYQQRFPSAKILILDNHDDFGGHARRNEFHAELDGKPIFRLSYGGSESIDSPKSHYSSQALNLLKALGIDYPKFEQYFDQKLFDTLQLKKGVFFNKKTFGHSKVLAQEPDASNADKFFANAPLSDTSKKELIALYQQPKNYLASMPTGKRTNYLKSISYDKFLTDHVKLSAEAKVFLQDICLEYWGFPIDGLSAWDALNEGYAGFDKIGIKVEASDSEPYIYHFPDGNASIARLLVKKLIPNVVSNPEHSQNMSAMEAIVLDQFDYNELDKPNQNVALRLNSTVVQAVNNQDGKVTVGYQTGDKLHRVTAKHTVLACYSVMMPHIVPTLPTQQKDNYHQNVKVPLIYAKVLVKNWQAFKKLGVYHLYSPTAPYCLVMLDYPVSMGGYDYPKNPDEPMVIHLASIPVPYGKNTTLREACKQGRSELYRKSYEDLEREMLAQLREIYEQAGETLDDKILAITINRWGHGYSYEENILWDKPAEAEKVLASVKTPLGNIHFANSDVNWQPYANAAIDQAWRAVGEIKG